MKTRGLWKLALLAFLLRRKPRTLTVHVHLTDHKGKQTCVSEHGTHSLTGQATDFPVVKA